MNVSPQTQGISRRRQLFVALGIVSSFAAWSGLMPWKTAVPVLAFFQSSFFWVLLWTAALAVLLRWKVLGSRARPVAVTVLTFLLNSLFLANRWIPSDVTPTLLFRLASLHGTLLFLTLGLDALSEKISRFLSTPRAAPLKTPLGAWLSWMLLALLFTAVVKDADARVYSSLVGVASNAQVVLFPLLTFLVRRSLGKPGEYLMGLLLFSLFRWLAPDFPSLRALSAFWEALPLYVMSGVHVYREELLAFLKHEKLRRFLSRGTEKVRAWGAAFRRRLDGPSAAAAPGGRFQGVLKRPALKKAGAALAGLFLLALAGWGLKALYNRYTVRIVDFSPSGEVSDRVVIRVAFTDPVTAAGALHEVDCFRIEPPLAGAYRQEAPQTIVFVPKDPLKPSTRYTVRFDPKNLRSRGKRFPFGARTEFHTPFFGVSDVKLMYQFDLFNDQEMEVVGELEFNQPVGFDALKAHFSLAKDGKPLPASLEKTNNPARFYFKIAGLSRQVAEQKVSLRIKEGLTGLDGTVPLERDYFRELVLPSKPKLAVAEIKLWHESGDTLVSVLFNMPVSADQVRRNVSISPSVGFEVETEYAYAVLRGRFLPNVSYIVTVAQGLVAKSGQVLEKEVKRGVTIQDLPPKVEFSYPGRVLSLNGPKTLEFKTMNLDRVNFQIQKVFRNNLLLFLNNQEYPPMAKHIASGGFNVQGGEVNENVPQYINLAALHDQPYKGLFTLELRDPKSYYNRSSSWFLCTDLGLLAKQSGDDLIVFVQSVESLASLPGVTVELMSNDNQVMDKQTTDGTGRVLFPHWRKHEYGLQPAFLVAKKDDDFSFLNFNGMELNAYQFSVGGVSHGGQRMEAFLATERGVYRPGESAYITAVVRNGDGGTPPAVPLLLVVRDPRGAEFRRLEARPDANGLATFEAPFPGDSLTGEYDLSLLRSDRHETLGSTTLKLEEFIPDKLKVEIETPKTPVPPGQKLPFTVKARQLFGPPASGNKVEGWVRFTARDFSHPAYKDYTFHDPLRSFEEETSELGEDQLDAQGRLPYEVEVPTVKVPSALRAYMYAEVYDSGGRPVSAAGTADIDCYPRYLGVKVEGTGAVLAKQKVLLRAVAITPDGKPQDVPGVRLVVKRKAWYSIFRRGSWGRSGYQSSSYEELVLDKTVDIKGGKASFDFTPEAEGEYTIVLADPQGMKTGVTVQALGLGVEANALEAPEKLQLLLDKPSYSPGETARLLIRSPFPGKVLLTLEREKVLETRVVEMPGREASVTLPVDASFLPNVYVVGVATRRTDEKNRALPMVSFGVVSLDVKKDSKKLDLGWEVPEEVQSKNGIDVVLSVEGDPAKTGVVLAAVDEGILQITGFQTPDPLEFFYRRRSLDARTYTMLDLLLPDIAEAKKFAIGGGDGGEYSRRHLNPVVAKKRLSYAKFSGVLKPGPDGRVRHRFDTKNFTGEARIMAMAVRGDKYGSSSRPVRVADPIVLIPHFPRFAGPRDQFQVPVEIHNKTGKNGEFSVSLEADGPVKVQEARKTVPVDKDGSKRLLFFVQADPDAGVAKFRVAAAGNGFDALREEELSIRPYSPLKTVVEQGTLNPGSSDDVKVPAGMIPFGQRLRLSVSSNPLIRYLRGLDYLITYPYGCTEQIVSRSFPLLYMKELGYATGRFGDKANAVDLFIQEGIDDLEKRQLSSGEFSLWPGGGSAGSYVSLYASHFLLEAADQGYNVSVEALRNIRGYINRVGVEPATETYQEGDEGEDVEPRDESSDDVDQVVDDSEGRLDRRGQNLTLGQVDAYKVYLKALADMPDREAMSLLYTQRLKQLGESDRAWLSLSYARLGDLETAKKVLTPDFKSKFLHREQYGDFNSSIRNTALYLYALAAADPSSKKVNEVVEYLGQNVKDGHFGNTQENVWTFMALSKVFGARGEPLRTEVLADGQPYKTFEGRESNALDNALSGKKLTLKNAGAQKSFYYFMAEGTPLERGTKSYSKGLTVSRALRTPEGKDVNLSNVAQGDLMVVTLTVSPENESVHNVVIVDLLPGGVEVENPRLTSRGQLGFDPPQGFSAAYQDIRDDRVLLFADEVSGEQSFSYTVRAVTPGRFAVPNAYAEAMYDPEVRAESAGTDSLVIAENNGGK